MGARLIAVNMPSTLATTLSKSGMVAQVIDSSVTGSPALRPSSAVGKAAPIKACVIGDAKIALYAVVIFFLAGDFDVR